MKVSQLKIEGGKRESSSRFSHVAATFRFFFFFLCTCVILLNNTCSSHVLFFFLVFIEFLVVNASFLVLLVLRNQVVHVALSLSEFHFIHTFSSVPMQESLATEHSSELLRNALEQLLDGGRVTNNTKKLALATRNSMKTKKKNKTWLEQVLFKSITQVHKKKKKRSEKSQQRAKILTMTLFSLLLFLIDSFSFLSSSRILSFVP